VTVREVYEALLERRKVAYTTVMTMLKILEQKKYLKKTQAERAQRLPAGAAEGESDRRHGAGVRQPRLQRVGRAAAGAPGGRGRA
jgi:predicted transcriptional regulator